jgi:Spy/CpxP family protein refolding chaperone
MFCFGCTALAEDPIVVHYSDPSLVRLEKQIGITPAQRDRFDDIIVKYRDPANNVAASNGNENDTASSDDQKRKHGRAGRKGTFGGGKRNIPRQELAELATILTPEQIKKFEDLGGKKGKGKVEANGR